MTHAHLPALEHVDGKLYIASNTALTTVDLSNFRTATSRVQFWSNAALTSVDVSSLDTHEVIFFGSHALTALSFPSLTAASTKLDIQQCDLLQSISAPNLVEVKALYIKKLKKITTLDLGKLKVLTDVQMQENDILATLNLPNLYVTSGTMWIQDNPELISVTLGTVALNKLYVERNDKLVSVAFPRLVTVSGFIAVGSNPLLTTLQFPEVASVATQIKIEKSASITAISFPKLEQVGNLLIEQNDLLTSIDVPRMTSFTGNVEIEENPELLSVDMTQLSSPGLNIKFRANPKLNALNICSLNSAWLTGTFILLNPSASFSCQGPVSNWPSYWGLAGVCSNSGCPAAGPTPPTPVPTPVPASPLGAPGTGPLNAGQDSTEDSGSSASNGQTEGHSSGLTSGAAPGSNQPQNPSSNPAPQTGVTIAGSTMTPANSAATSTNSTSSDVTGMVDPDDNGGRPIVLAQDNEDGISTDSAVTISVGLIVVIIVVVLAVVTLILVKKMTSAKKDETEGQGPADKYTDQEEKEQPKECWPAGGDIEDDEKASNLEQPQDGFDKADENGGTAATTTVEIPAETPAHDAETQSRDVEEDRVAEEC